MIDLHIHSFFSDGYCSPEIFLQKTQPGDILSFTDHNTLAGFWSVAKYAPNGMCLLPGVELRLFGKPDFLWYFPEYFSTGAIPDSALDLLHLIAASEYQCNKKRLSNKYSSIILDNACDLYCHMYEYPCDRHFDNEDWLKSDYIATCLWENKTVPKRMEIEKKFAKNRNALLSSIRRENSAIYKKYKKNFQSIGEISNLGSSEFLEYFEDKGGSLVLAHPLRGFRREQSRDNISPTWENFSRWLEEWIRAGLTCVECCFGDQKEIESFHDLDHKMHKNIWNILKEEAECKRFFLTPGSDLHTFSEEETSMGEFDRGLQLSTKNATGKFDNAEDWYQGMLYFSERIFSYLPNWVKNLQGNEDVRL